MTIVLIYKRHREGTGHTDKSAKKKRIFTPYNSIEVVELATHQNRSNIDQHRYESQVERNLILIAIDHFQHIVDIERNESAKHVNIQPRTYIADTI